MRTCRAGSIEDELGALIRGLRRAPGSVPAARCLRRRRVDRPGMGRVPHLQAGHRRRIDAAMAALAAAAPVGRLHRRQPRLCAPGRVPHGCRHRSRGCRATASVHLHLLARPDPLRARAGRPGDLPDGTPLHVPAGLLPPDRPGHRPGPRSRLRTVDPGRSSATSSPADNLGAYADLDEYALLHQAARWARGESVAADPRPGDGAVTPVIADAWRAILLRQPTWRAEAEIRAEYEADARPEALIASLGVAEPGRSAIDLAEVDARPADASAADSLLALETRDGAAASVSSALASIPAYWLIGRRYRKIQPGS